MNTGKCRIAPVFYLPLLPVVVFALVMIAIMVSPPRAAAMSDADSKTMFTQLVHSYYENEPDKFWGIVSKFQKPQFRKSEDVRDWMNNRLVPQMTYLKVKGIIVIGKARIASEEIGKIDFRFDGAEGAESRIVVVTAFVHRVFEFDDTVPPEHKIVTQEAVMKIYVTLVKERLNSYKSDEINLGYEFASR